jgi:leader peptidase (prepilin peptidase)/N-methyltransferase
MTLIAYYALTYVMLFMLGAALTSFMIALIYRIENRMPYPQIFTEGSKCEECEKRLQWYELVPVFSFVFAKGRCRRCGYKVSPTYPIFEAVLGIVFCLFFYLSTPYLVYVVSIALYFLALYDYYYRGFPKIVMNIFIIIAALFAVLALLIEYDKDRLYSVFVAGGISIMIIILNRLKESFGVGDILVYLFLGFLIPFQQLILVLVLSLIVGGIVAFALLVVGKVDRKSKIPFVPFIFVAYVLSFVFVEQFSAYLDTMSLM